MKRNKNMKALALIGSPRKEGNSAILADYVLKVLKEKGAIIEKIYLDDYYIRPIGEVIDNSRIRTDSRNDDDLPKILNKFLQADVIIWSTPIYWFGVSAQMKCFIDRLSSYFNVEPYKQKFINKGHIVLCTYGRKEKKHAHWVITPMKEMIKVIRGKFLGQVSVNACYEKGKIKERKDILIKARKLGKRCSFILRKRY